MLKRNEVPENLTWDITQLYKNVDEYKKDLEKAEKMSEDLYAKYFKKMENSQDINNCLDDYAKYEEIVDLLNHYVYMSVETDYTNLENQSLSMEFNNRLSKMNAKLSFIRGEISKLSDFEIEKAQKESKKNANFLRKLLRNKPHRLDESVEKTLNELSSLMQSPYIMYNTLKLADMEFPKFNVNGKSYDLSYNLFEGKFETEANRQIRHEAFKSFYSVLEKYKNTTAMAYETEVQKQKSLATLRGFESVTDYLLFPQEISKEHYNRQLDTIMEKLAPHMRRYAMLLKRLYGLEKMTHMDFKMPLDPDMEPKISIEEAKEYMVKGFSDFGSDYVNMLERAFDERWIDFAQNEGKSTGAFCSTSYLGHPYVLINWTESMTETMVLAHELGHAGHFYLNTKEQNIFDMSPSLYFIEAPSTANELIMANYLLKNAKDKREKRWVLSQMISRTYFHNFVTHFIEAYYEREVYKLVDVGKSVNAQILSDIFKKTLEKFWGEEIEISKGAELTWMRQPHYYMGLYSYTYSCGLTIGTQMSRRIMKEGQSAVSDWIEVLKAGGSRTPVELARMAGVDIISDEPLKSAIAYIGSLVDEIEKLTDEIDEAPMCTGGMC